jgi:hypothetical protein
MMGWRRRRKKQQSATRHPMIDWDAQPLGEVPDRVLAERLGVSINTVWRRRNQRGIPPHRGKGRPSKGRWEEPTED